jgi:hypothetical protein
MTTKKPLRARANASPVRDVIDDVCRIIEDGWTPVSRAAWQCGVHPEALESRARHDDAIREKLMRSRAKAYAVRVAKLLDCIEEGKPTAGVLWMMERLDRDVLHLPTLVQLDARMTSGDAATPDQVARLKALIAKLEDVSAAALPIDATPRSPGEGGGE